MAVTSSGAVSVPATVMTATSGVMGAAPVGSVSGGAGGSGASTSRVGSSVGASSSRAGGSGLGSSRAGGSGPPPSTTSGGDVSMGALAALISRAVTEGMVAAGAVGFSPPSPVVSTPCPAPPSRPTPPVGSVRLPLFLQRWRAQQPRSLHLPVTHLLLVSFVIIVVFLGFLYFSIL